MENLFSNTRTEISPPPKLTGSEFETILLERLRSLEVDGRATFGRYGVQAVFGAHAAVAHGASQQAVEAASKLIEELGLRRTPEEVIALLRAGVQTMRSLPDFEGINRFGVQTVIDAKVCSAASFSWDKYRSETKGERSRQLRHMLKRSRFGGSCYFVLHWNERQLSKKTVDPVTFALRVDHKNPYWEDVETGAVKSLSLADCWTLAIEVPWTVPPRCQKKVPVVESFIPGLRSAL